MGAITDRRFVHVLPDPPVPGAPDGQWWPPVALTTAWLRANSENVDALHVHFGLESFSPAELGSALAAARDLELPVVYTVHDLENPQLRDQTAYGELLDIIVPGADHLITLTAGAGAEVAHRWGRECEIIPHPLLAGHAGEGPARAPRGETVRVGMHLRDLRPNIDAAAAVRAAAEAAKSLEGGDAPVVIEILLNERVRDVDLAARLETVAAQHPSVHMRRTARLSDADIEAWLTGLDLFVLPYRHGTHSGWVELCFDLGVPVAGTAVGHVASQHPSSFRVIDLDDPATLAAAIRRSRVARQAADQPAARDTRHRARRHERDEVRAAHLALYRRAIAEVAQGRLVEEGRR
ncbi:glycosyltransferase [Microbacterium sp. ET2]|uniref:glycosyltransferase n=1 Tax=Microbacterium albipurpureum TaxID=3050384 RepID=UPI00259CCA4E|nr:glycosyltransferase [Microbacterium sp. ET2 (Ac-2212)]WJL96598.1 glycosyltransferase [Microbacterium sp. ET2 (Ac-2212)]